MTACVDNEKKKGGAAKAVSATLAGVLAVGMVPAVAFATEGEAPADEGDVSLLAQTEVGAFGEGRISAYKDGAGLSDTYVAGTKNGPVPTAVQPKGEGVDPIEVTTFFSGQSSFTPGTVYYGYIKIDEDASSQVPGGPGQQFKFANGDPVYGTWAYNLNEPGEYAVVVFRADANGNVTAADNYVALADTFTVAAADFTQAVITFGNNKTEQPIVFNDTAYAFDDAGTDANDLHIYLNGELIPDSAVTKEIVTANTLVPTPAQYAGSYKVRLDGVQGTAYEDVSNVYIDLTIVPYDLGSAAVVLNDKALQAAGANYTTTIASVDGDSAHWLIGKNYLQLSDYTPDPTGAGTYSATVEPNATVAANPALAASITGTTTASYYVVDQLLSEGSFLFKYDGNPAKDYATDGIVIDYSASDFSSKPGEASNSFDASKITLELNGVELEDGTTTLDSSEYDLVVTNTKTKEVGGIDMLSESGSYTLHATLKADAIDYQFAGSTRDIPVTVTQGKIGTADVTFAYQGKVVDQIIAGMMEYDGTDQTSEITISVETTQGAAVDAADYTVTIKKANAAGKYVEVDGIVGAGDYQVIVTSDKYEIQGADEQEVLPVHVDQITIEKIRVAGTVQIKDNNVLGKEFLPYTGSEITPVVECLTRDQYNQEVWSVLPADQYKITEITYSENVGAETDTNVEVDAVNAVGRYWIDLEAAFASAAAGQNYNLNGNSALNLRVSDAEVFLDVPTDAWYYADVLTAANNKWIYGYNKGDFFGPNDSIKRGDVCMILARVAGKDLAADEGSGSDFKYYETPFTDVNGNLYYAEAIAWAANVGIVQGDDGEGTFRPEDTITRQEFAAMLARFAENAGDFAAADVDAELAKYADGDAVAGWADDAVAWASAEGIMNGVGDTGVLAPERAVTRAEVAKMIVTYRL